MASPPDHRQEPPQRPLSASVIATCSGATVFFAVFGFIGTATVGFAVSAGFAAAAISVVMSDWPACVKARQRLWMLGAGLGGLAIAEIVVTDALAWVRRHVAPFQFAPHHLLPSVPGRLLLMTAVFGVVLAVSVMTALVARRYAA